MVRSRSKALLAAVAVVAILATALAGTVAFANPAGLPADDAGRTLSVNGAAQVTLKPDIAYVTLGTLTQDAGAAAARTANNKLMGSVYAALKAQGVDTDRDVKTTNYSMYPRYDETGKKITGYEISNNIQVKVRNLDKLGGIIEAATSAGANTSNGLYFDVEDREGAYNQALEQAIANARLRAETLVKSAGATLGAVVSASESGSYNPWPVYYGRDLAADGGVPVSSGTMQVSASVSVTFELR
jgi:uncharacterized protein YggE